MKTKRMRKYTNRFVVYLTDEELLLVQVAAEKTGLPQTVFARKLIMDQVNPLFKDAKK